MADPRTASENDAVYCSIKTLLQLRRHGNDIQLHRTKRTNSQIDGSIRTRFRGRGMEFSEVRPYTPGDDIRTIDWRVTARTQVTHTKLFQEERERPVFVVLDQRSPMFFGTQTVFKSVFGACLAASIAWSALSNNDRVGAIILGDTDVKDIRPKRGKHALLNVLHFIHTFNHKLTTPIHNVTTGVSGITLQQQLDDLARVAKPGSAIYIVSDFFDINHMDPASATAFTQTLTKLSRHCDVNLIHPYDTFEAQLPDNKNLTFSNGKQRVQINTHTKTVNTFHAHFKQKQHVLNALAKKSGAFFSSVDISLGLESALKTLFVLNSTSRRSR